MNYRQTKLYKTMNHLTACAYAEGFCEGEGASEKNQLTAWQYIWDKNLWRNLQGWYGRTVHGLINQGVINQ